MSTRNIPAPVSILVSSPDGKFVKVIFVARDSPGLRCCSIYNANDLTMSEK